MVLHSTSVPIVIDGFVQLRPKHWKTAVYINTLIDHLAITQHCATKQLCCSLGEFDDSEKKRNTKVSHEEICVIQYWQIWSTEMSKLGYSGKEIAQSLKVSQREQTWCPSFLGTRLPGSPPLASRRTSSWTSASTTTLASGSSSSSTPSTLATCPQVSCWS